MSNRQESQVGEALAKASVDREFREQLVADPADTLKKAGVELPADLGVELVEVSETRMVLVIPPFEGDKLSQDQLEEVAAGKMLMTNFVTSGTYGLFAGSSNEAWSLIPLRLQAK